MCAITDAIRKAGIASKKRVTGLVCFFEDGNLKKNVSFLQFLKLLQNM